jgi:hypothetical protein
MSNTYLRGSTLIKYLNVLRITGTVPVYPTDYATPTYSICYKNGAFNTVVLDAPMTQGLDNVWYLKYTIPTGADLGTYLIKYKIDIDNTATEATEDYIVSVSHHPSPSTGQFPVTDNVESDTMEDLTGVGIYVFLPSDTTSAIQFVTTGVAGQFTLYLDAGTYEVLFHKEGYINEVHALVVHSDGTFTFDGN